MRSKGFRTDFFFKSKTHEESTYFIIQNKLHWYIYRLLQGRTVSEELPKIPLFGHSLIHHLRLLGSHQHPQSWALLTAFSTWGTENSLAEINLESTVGEKMVVTLFGGQKLAETWSFVGGRIIVQQEKISRAEPSRTIPLNALQEAIHCSFIKFCIYCFFPSSTNSLCTTP